MVVQAFLLLMFGGLHSAMAFSRAEWEVTGWVTEYQDGLSRARAAEKPAFVYFDAKWCSWCQQYKRETLDSPEVRSKLSRDFVRIAVDYDARPDLMHRFGGKGLPFTLILTPNENVIAGFVGVMQAQDLLALLKTRQPVRLAPATNAQNNVTYRVASTDRKGYDAFLAAYLRHLDSLYEPTSGMLSGRFETGVTLKRTPLLAWSYLTERGLWKDRVGNAAHAMREKLWDPLDTGFFNFIDPSRDGYLETSKLLEINAWMAAWQAQSGVQDPEARRTARLAWYYLRHVLWDRERGGFFQAQIADNAYYALLPSERLRRQAPSLDRAKRTDTNAQAVWALLRLGRISGDTEVTDYAEKTMDFLLRDMWNEGRLYHIWRNRDLSTPDQPRNWFWVLAAGAELERVRPNRLRRDRLAAIANAANAWLSQQLRGKDSIILDNELAGLIAYTTGERDLYAMFPTKSRDWALRQLRIETETLPDEPVIGLMAWEQKLERNSSRRPPAHH